MQAHLPSGGRALWLHRPPAGVSPGAGHVLRLSQLADCTRTWDVCVQCMLASWRQRGVCHRGNGYEHHVLHERSHVRASASADICLSASTESEGSRQTCSESTPCVQSLTTMWCISRPSRPAASKPTCRSAHAVCLSPALTWPASQHWRGSRMKLGFSGMSLALCCMSAGCWSLGSRLRVSHRDALLTTALRARMRLPSRRSTPVAVPFEASIWATCALSFMVPPCFLSPLHGRAIWQADQLANLPTASRQCRPVQLP